MQEEDLVKAIEVAHDAIRIQVKAQEELRALERCYCKKRIYKTGYMMKRCEEKVNAFAKQKVYEVAKGKFSKHERSDKFAAIKEELMEYLKAGY